MLVPAVLLERAQVLNDLRSQNGQGTADLSAGAIGPPAITFRYSAFIFSISLRLQRTSRFTHASRRSSSSTSPSPRSSSAFSSAPFSSAPFSSVFTSPSSPFAADASRAVSTTGPEAVVGEPTVVFAVSG